MPARAFIDRSKFIVHARAGISGCTRSCLAAWMLPSSAGSLLLPKCVATLSPQPPTAPAVADHGKPSARRFNKLIIKPNALRALRTTLSLAASLGPHRSHSRARFASLAKRDKPSPQHLQKPIQIKTHAKKSLAARHSHSLVDSAGTHSPLTPEELPPPIPRYWRR